MSDEEPTKPAPLAHLIMPFAFPGALHALGGETRDYSAPKAMTVGSGPLRLFTAQLGSMNVTGFGGMFRTTPQ